MQHAQPPARAFPALDSKLTNAELGKRQIVAILVPGDFCDLNACVLDAMNHSIATPAPSSVARIPRETMVKLMSRPAIAGALFKTTLVDGATLRAWIANIGARKAEQQVAHLFCELHARMQAVVLAPRWHRDDRSISTACQLDFIGRRWQIIASGEARRFLWRNRPELTELPPYFLSRFP